MSHITFGLIKTVLEYVKGLEVESSQEWEWRKAIFEGARVYHELRQVGQGTVTVDLESRSLTFDPCVHVGIPGVVRELGTSTLNIQEIEFPTSWINQNELSIARNETFLPELVATKMAILNALGFSESEARTNRDQITLTRMKSGTFSVHTIEQVRARIWEKGIIEFNSTLNHLDNIIVCNVVALADTKDTTP